MKRNLYILTLCAAVVFPASCVKNTLYNTSHPSEGAVVVTPDWSLRSSDASIPATYVLHIGADGQEVSGGGNVFKSLFSPGQQQLLVYNPAEKMTVTGNIASVDTLADGTAEPLPGHLFAGAQLLSIPADDTLKTTVVMQQYTRTVTVVLTLKPGDEQLIASTAATLTGVTTTVDLLTGTPAAPGSRTVCPVFTPATSQSRPVLTASLRLTGVAAGEKQLLTLAVGRTNQDVQHITTDLTAALKDFGSASSPLRLEAALRLPAEAGMTATITGWTVVDNGRVDVY